MYARWNSIFRPEASLFAGVLLVGVLGFLRPFILDFSHVIAFVTAGGGRAMHAAHLELGKDLFNQNTIFISASVAPPVQGDFRVDISGPEALDYSLSSRYPPAIPITNRGHAWYTFEDGVFEGVYPGDDLALVVKVRRPETPGEYSLTLTDVHSNQTYLSVPIIFSGDAPAGAAGDCH